MELLPEVAQHIRNFHRVKVKNGRMEWEIKADDARYFAKDNTVVVRAPELSVYTEGGTLQAWVTGEEGRLVLAGQEEITSVVLTGSVVLWLRRDGAAHRPGHLRSRWRPDHRPGRRHHHGARHGRSREAGMQVDVTPQLIHLLDDVRTVLRSDAAPS